MPIYEYRCSACGHELELWQRLSDPPARRCHYCQRETLKRQISHTSFVLKGGGWYADGYSKPGAAAAGP